MSLPESKPFTKAGLVRFDITDGLPAAVGTLRKHLGPMQVLRVLTRYAALGLRDPLRDIERTWPEPQETLSRHQLKAAVVLDDALRTVVDDDRRIEILGEVIAASGGRFLEKAIPIPSIETWLESPNEDRESFLTDVSGNFFNAKTETVYASKDSLGFDMSACRFAEVTRALGRDYMGPMFCAADAVYFARDESPVTLTRETTIAGGGSHCAFRFQFKPAAISPPGPDEPK